MFTIIETFKSEKKILVEIAACKFVEGFFILLGAMALVKFIIEPTLRITHCAFLIAFFAGRFFLSGMTEKFFARLSVNVQTSFRKKIHEKFLAEEISSGELLTLIFDTLQALDDFFLKVAPQISSAIIFLPIFLIGAALVDLLTAGILLVTLPIAPLLLWLIGKATSEKNSRAWAELQRLNADFRELLAAITTLKMFNCLDAGKQRLKETSRKSSAATLDVLKLAFVSSFALELITTLSIALVAVTLGLRLISGGVEFQAALFLLLMAPEFFLPIRKFGVAFHVMISARSSLERLKNFLRDENHCAFRIAHSALKLPPTISLDAVSFTYPKKKSPVLQGVTLKFSAGKVTALTGTSGAGKSTLLKLLAGILQPTAGSIKFTDVETHCALRIAHSTLLPQAPHLFETTLEKNFTMFLALDDKLLKKFLSALNLSTLNLNAPQKLSRGQLQRLGLIRALLKDSPIILLDEPTAGLDEATEQKVLTLIKEISPRKTIIIATHRLAVIEFADEVQSLN
ncbi:MAG: ATP-binding cassette domain-containing protein [Selenomonadaceae bacterium]|nr:ATP-binding cassette domain-containing protein [Selenomonadaceae bacterium]